MTALEMITSALRLIGVLDETEVPSAEQGENSLQSFNELMYQWEKDGIRLGWYTITDLDNTIPIKDQDRRGVRHNLAMELAGEYGIEPTQKVQQIAQMTFDSLAKEYIQYFESSMEHLPVAAPWGKGLVFPNM